MSSKTLANLLLLSCFATGLVAQNITVPAIMAGVEGGGGTNVPFGGSLACRYQCVYDAELRAVVELGVRRELRH